MKSEEYLSTEKSNKLTEEDITNYSSGDLSSNKNPNQNSQNLMYQIDNLNKEKNGLESQLVIIKMKFAELSSNYEDLMDLKAEIQRKYEEANQKVLLKEDLIQELMYQAEKEYPNENKKKPIEISSNDMDDYTYKPSKTIENNHSNYLCTDRNERKGSYQTNTTHGNKRESNFLGDIDVDYNDDVCVTTLGFEGSNRRSEDFDKSENVKNAKALKDFKKKENKSNGLFGSIKGFFKSEKK